MINIKINKQGELFSHFQVNGDNYCARLVDGKFTVYLNFNKGSFWVPLFERDIQDTNKWWAFVSECHHFVDDMVNEGWPYKVGKNLSNEYRDTVKIDVMMEATDIEFDCDGQKFIARYDDCGCGQLFYIQNEDGKTLFQNVNPLTEIDAYNIIEKFKADIRGENVGEQSVSINMKRYKKTYSIKPGEVPCF